MSKSHASGCWLNQVEIYFSIVQGKVLSPNDFAVLDVLAERLLDFNTANQQPGGSIGNLRGKPAELLLTKFGKQPWT